MTNRKESTVSRAQAARAAASAPPALRPPPGDHARFRLVRVLDEHGFHEPVEAYRFLVPSDWQVQSWLRWRPDMIYCPSNPIDGGARG